MRLAILGGSFNPIHMGHLIAAEEIRVTLHYDTILFVPAFIPPHKARITEVAPEDRATMVARAIDTNPHFEMSDFEIARGGISYTIETVRHFYEHYQGRIEGNIALIIGDDLIDGLPTWHKVDDLAKIVDFIVVSREHELEEMNARMTWEAIYCVIPQIELSSTMIRTRIAAGVDCRYLVPESVREYIREKALYT